jgi:hypothetical protein
VNATPKEIVISCADCTNPAVYFFNNELNVFDGGEFDITNPNNKDLHVAV